MILLRVDTLFFLLSVVSLAFGIASLALVHIFKNNMADRVTGSLMYPLVFLTCISFPEILNYYMQFRYPEGQFRILTLFYEWGRIMIALSWIYIAYYHYALNGVDIMRKAHICFFSITAAVLCLGSSLFLFPKPGLMSLIHVIVIAMFYFAGIKGVLILRKTRNLLPSSITAIIIAGLSLVAYPVIAVGEVFGLRIPFLDPRMSLRLQAHPIYVFLVNIPIAVFLVRYRTFLWTIQPQMELSLNKVSPLLTEREMEVFVLLYRGFATMKLRKNSMYPWPLLKHIFSIFTENLKSPAGKTSS